MARDKRSVQIVGALALALVGGAGFFWAACRASQSWGEFSQELAAGSESVAPPSDRFLPELLPLAQEPAQRRRVSLERLAGAGSVRARYLLAVDAIALRQPERALNWLDGLERDYPALAPFVRLQSIRARELVGDHAQVRDLRLRLLDDFPNSAAAATAACDLGRAAQPQHPCSWDLARQRLRSNPQDFEALQILVRYQPRASDANQLRDRLAKTHGNRLNSQDWELIADGYWQTWEYGRAANAYDNTARTARNLYRSARSRQLSARKPAAKTIYLQVLREFPTDPNSGWALLRLAALSPSSDALRYLDRAIAEFPERAPEALRTKAGILARLGNSSSATATSDRLLRDYPDSEAALTYGWEQARKAWLAGDIVRARTLASDVHSAKAQFWVAKWHQQLGDSAAARTQFETVLRDFPESYYAWRSATFLGYNVGNFTNARRFAPPLVAPAPRSSLPAGSVAVSELYLLGQDADAFGLWQFETSDFAENFTAEEQFVDGVLHLTQGNHLIGINQVWRLQDRDDPADRDRWLAFREDSAYWHALYPLPFAQPIRSWSAQRQINPLLVASLIRQESRFEPKIRSRSNAAGLMQILPSTGKWISGKIGQPRYSLDNPEDNVKFGTWYLRYTHERYDNNSMLAIASYNGGPGNVAKWIDRYGLADVDRFVELIPFAETKGYVESVFGNYWNYLRLYSPDTIPPEAELFPRD